MSVLGRTYNSLTTSTALTALVSSSIWPEKRLQGSSLPAVIYYRVPGGERVNSLQGYHTLENAIVAIEVHSTGMDERREVANTVITAMTGSVYFSCILPDPPYDDFDDDTQIYERVMEFSVWNHE